jgi:hypothetical protein
MEERTNIIIYIIVGVCIVFFLAFGLFAAYTIISTLDYANLSIGRIAQGSEEQSNAIKQINTAIDLRFRVTAQHLKKPPQQAKNLTVRPICFQRM